MTKYITRTEPSQWEVTIDGIKGQGETIQKAQKEAKEAYKKAKGKDAPKNGFTVNEVPGKRFAWRYEDIKDKAVEWPEDAKLNDDLFKAKG